MQLGNGQKLLNYISKNYIYILKWNYFWQFFWDHSIEAWKYYYREIMGNQQSQRKNYNPLKLSSNIVPKQRSKSRSPYLISYFFPKYNFQKKTGNFLLFFCLGNLYMVYYQCDVWRGIDQMRYISKQEFFVFWENLLTELWPHDQTILWYIYFWWRSRNFNRHFTIHRPPWDFRNSSQLAQAGNNNGQSWRKGKVENFSLNLIIKKSIIEYQHKLYSNVFK